uniref:Uncharacterized protein n=1 Tax=Knipowitschia caucasica TaxID=637954 RepID=A0AAV2MI68_KNICA
MRRLYVSKQRLITLLFKGSCQNCPSQSVSPQCPYIKRYRRKSGLCRSDPSTDLSQRTMGRQEPSVDGTGTVIAAALVPTRRLHADDREKSPQKSSSCLGERGPDSDPNGQSWVPVTASVSEL